MNAEFDCMRILFDSKESLQRRSRDQQKQPPKGVLKERCSENMQQIYMRTPMTKCDCTNAAKQLY